MIFLQLYRLFFGYVSFTASDGFHERFINLCAKNGILLWNLDIKEDILTACTSVKHYKKIKTCAVRSGTITKINEKHGLPFFAAKHRRRVGLLYAAVFAVSFLAVMSTMVWSIDISGNNRVTDEQILEVLEQAGVRHGALRKSIDPAYARFYSLEKLPDLSYLTVNLIGSCIQVKVSEHAPEPTKPNTAAPCNVVSTVDGQIVTLEVYHGTKLYKSGEAVRAGEVLAGGYIELSDGAVRFKHAEAYALLRTNIDFETVTQRNMPTLAISEEKKKVTFHILGFDIPLGKSGENKPTLSRRHTLVINGKSMPFAFTVETYRTLTPESKTLSDEELRLSAAEAYLGKKSEMLSEAFVHAQQTKTNETDSGITIMSNTVAEISAGVAKEMLIE